MTRTQVQVAKPTAPTSPTPIDTRTPRGRNLPF